MEINRFEFWIILISSLFMILITFSSYYYWWKTKIWNSSDEGKVFRFMISVPISIYNLQLFVRVLLDILFGIKTFPY